MKLWKARSAAYETFFFSALSRSLYCNSLWLFGTSLFVKTVGSKGWSALYFFGSICALLYYVYFVMRGHKGEEPYNVYKVTLILALLFSVACYLEPTTSFLQPFHAVLLYCLIASVMTIDLIDTTLGPLVLQASVNPAIFREVYQRMIVTAEVVARIAGAALIWLLSQCHVLSFIYQFAWSMLLVHFILFGITVKGMRAHEIKADMPLGNQAQIIDTISRSLRFIFSNSLVRVATIVLVWSTLTRFVLEYIFYQVADARFGSATELASFLSMLTMSIYVLSLLAHHFIIRTLTARLQLSSLLSIQPINIMLLGAAALFMAPFWPLVLLTVTYNIVHRSIQLPLLRQCMVPIPRTHRGIILSIISIIVSIACLITSGSMSALKNLLHLQDFLILFLLLGLAIFFMIINLDSHYVRNLWSLFREVRSGSWQNEPQSESLSAAVAESDGAVEPVAALMTDSDLHGHPILETYAFSNDRSKLLSVTDEHKQLLHSKNPEHLLAGLRICFVAEFPWLDGELSKAAVHNDLKVQAFALKALKIGTQFANLEDYSCAFRRRIKSVAMDLLDAPSRKDTATGLDARSELEARLDIDARSDIDYVSALTNLTRLPVHDHAEALLAVIADVKFTDLRRLLLECIAGDGARLTVKPIVTRMYEIEYETAHIYRWMLKQLAFGKSEPELRSAIESNLAALKRDQFTLRQEPSAEQMRHLQNFMHTLFLDEYRLSLKELDEALIETISEFQIFSREERDILMDMHISFLKQSDFLRDWQALMA